jgi:hypothetical protein
MNGPEEQNSNDPIKTSRETHGGKGALNETAPKTTNENSSLHPQQRTIEKARRRSRQLTRTIWLTAIEIIGHTFGGDEFTAKLAQTSVVIGRTTAAHNRQTAAVPIL